MKHRGRVSEILLYATCRTRTHTTSFTRSLTLTHALSLSSFFVVVTSTSRPRCAVDAESVSTLLDAALECLHDLQPVPACSLFLLLVCLRVWCSQNTGVGGWVGAHKAVKGMRSSRSHSNSFSRNCSGVPSFWCRLSIRGAWSCSGLFWGSFLLRFALGCLLLVLCVWRFWGLFEFCFPELFFPL